MPLRLQAKSSRMSPANRASKNPTKKTNVGEG
jgi:hypothetical protein